MLRHGRKHAFEKFVDESKVLEPSPSAKMAQLSNFTIVVFSLHSVLASCLRSLRIARHWLLSTGLGFLFLNPTFILLSLSCSGCYYNPTMKQCDCQYNDGNGKLMNVYTNLCKQDHLFVFLNKTDICAQATPLIAFLSRREVEATPCQPITRTARLVASC